MALSPGIPTSFVPKQPTQAPVRPTSSGNNIFLFVTIIGAVITIAAAAATFAYDRYLQHELASKQAELADAQAKVDENSIEDFVRLRDRLTNGKDLLNNHVMLSQFLDVLEANTLQNVRFTTMKLTVAGDHTATLDMTGTAKTFNALAAQSNTLAAEKRIKRAIFSGITLTDTKLVTFKMTAEIDPKLVVEGTTVPAKSAAATTATTPVTTQATTTPVTKTSTATTQTTAPATTAGGATVPSTAPTP